MLKSEAHSTNEWTPEVLGDHNHFFISLVIVYNTEYILGISYHSFVIHCFCGACSATLKPHLCLALASWKFSALTSSSDQCDRLLPRKLLSAFPVKLSLFTLTQHLHSHFTERCHIRDSKSAAQLCGLGFQVFFAIVMKATLSTWLTFCISVKSTQVNPKSKLSHQLEQGPDFLEPWEHWALTEQFFRKLDSRGGPGKAGIFPVALTVGMILKQTHTSKPWIRGWQEELSVIILKWFQSI